MYLYFIWIESAIQKSKYNKVTNFFTSYICRISRNLSLTMFSLCKLFFYDIEVSLFFWFLVLLVCYFIVSTIVISLFFFVILYQQSEVCIQDTKVWMWCLLRFRNYFKTRGCTYCSCWFIFFCIISRPPKYFDLILVGLSGLWPWLMFTTKISSK